MSTPTSQRPPQVTFASGLLIGGGIWVVLDFYTRIEALRSLKSRDALEAMLSEPPLQGAGVSIETGFMVMQGALMVGGVAAIASAIFAGWCLRGDKQARAAVGVMAVPLLFVSLLTGSFLSMVIAAAALMLFLSPSKEWFRDGVWTPPTLPEPRERDASELGAQGNPPSVPPVIPPVSGVPQDGPRPGPYGQAWGTPYPQPGQEPGPESGQQPDPAQQGHAGVATLPGAQPVQQPAQYPVPPQPTPEQWAAMPPQQRQWVEQQAQHAQWLQQRAANARPAALTTAAVVTTLVAGLVGSMMGLVALVAGTSMDLLMREMRATDPDLAAELGSPDQLQQMMVSVGLTMAVWSTFAVILAWLAWRGSNGARVGLMISAAITLGFAVAAGVSALTGGGFLAFLPAAAAGWVLVLLRRSDVAAWVRRPR